MRFDLMSPPNYSGGANNSFMPLPDPQMDLVRSFSSYLPANPASQLTPSVVDPAGSLTGLGSFGSYGAMDAGYSGAGAAFGGAGKGMFGDIGETLKNWQNSDWGKAILGSKAADGTSTMGLGSLAIGGASALGNLYMGMKQYGLMEDQLSFAKDSFNKNWEAQKTTTNSQLEDRQAARVASNSSAYQSVGDYMKKNGIKG